MKNPLAGRGLLGKTSLQVLKTWSDNIASRDRSVVVSGGNVRKKKKTQNGVENHHLCCSFASGMKLFVTLLHQLSRANICVCQLSWTQRHNLDFELAERNRHAKSTTQLPHQRRPRSLSLSQLLVVRSMPSPKTLERQRSQGRIERLQYAW